MEAWRCYVSSKISELMKDETMQKPDFQKILEEVKEGDIKLRELRLELRELRKMWVWTRNLILGT